jgi:hypothetical protein
VRTVLFYDDDAHEGRASHSEIAALVNTVRSTLGPDVELIVEWDARKAFEWLSARPKASRPDLLIVDLTNELTGTDEQGEYHSERDTRITPTGECGLKLAQFSYEKWVGISIIYLTRSEQYSTLFAKADEDQKPYLWITKRGHNGTTTHLANRLRSLFSRQPIVQVGGLLLDDSRNDVSWRGGWLDLSAKQYQFMYVLMTQTLEKRQHSPGDIAVPFEAFGAHEDNEHRALHTLKYEICRKLKITDKAYARIAPYLTELDTDTVIRNSGGAYKMMEF